MARIPKREGQQVEFKRSFAEPNEANRKGGRVFFGVDDDGSPVSVQLGRKTLEDFAHRIRSNTQPNLAPDVRPLQVHGNRVVVANTRAAPPGTVYSAFGVPYIRVGKTNQLMPPPDIQRQIMATFEPQVRGNQPAGAIEDESWDERERRRIARRMNATGGCSWSTGGGQRANPAKLPTSRSSFASTGKVR